MSEMNHLDFDGHRLAYRVAGEGPVMVVLQLYRRREDTIQLRVLRHRWQVFEVTPLGYGWSDRVPDYAGDALADQVLAVLNHHGVNQFVIWGYSAGGAMATCIARSTPRAAGWVCGGFSPIDFLTDGVMRRLDRRLAPNHPGRSLWPWVKHFNWRQELPAMKAPGLFYWGSEDRQMASTLRRTREQLSPRAIDFLEFAGLDHGAFTEKVTAEVVVPAVAEWIEQRVGTAW